MNETERRFINESYRLLEATLSDRFPADVVATLALTGAAQAVLETGWGKSKGYHEHHNFLGIKPSGAQPAAGDIRIFRDLDDCAEAWAYLVTQSTLYDRPREDLIRAVEASRSNDPEAMRKALDAWLERFCAIYCPDPNYCEKVKALMVECYPVLTLADPEAPLVEIPFETLVTHLLDTVAEAARYAAEIQRRLASFHATDAPQQDPQPTS